MRVLVTGGNGFIGSHVVEALRQRGDEVVVLDMQTEPRRDDVEFWEGSVTDPDLVAAAMDGVELVIHLAAVVGVARVLEDPVEAIRVNLDGTHVVLKAAQAQVARRGWAVRTLVASTSEVYGLSDRQPLREDGEVVYGPTTVARWAYAYSKALDEQLALGLWRRDGLPVTCLRFFNITGPGQRPESGMVLPRFVADALAGEPLIVFGGGKQSRCFTDVDDVVPAVLALAACPAAIGEVVNVGSAREITMTQLARLVVRTLDSASEIRSTPYERAYPQGYADVARRVPSLEKIERLIDWRAQVPLEQMIVRVAEALHAAQPTARA